MKFTIVGDLHAKPNNLDKVNQIFDIVEGLGHSVIMLGDTFDTKEVIRGRCLNTVMERTKSSKLTFYYIIGNHDRFNVSSTEHSLEQFKLLKNVIVIDSPQQIIPGLAAIPYLHDRTEFKEAVKLFGESDIVFMHQGFSGFDYGNGFIAEGENDLSEISHLKQAISGHFHKYQQLGNLTYLGTPFSHSFGESNQEKFLGILDLNSGKMELINSPFPQHWTLELDTEEANNLVAQGLQDFDGHHIRFIIRGSQEQLMRYNKEALKGASTLEVKIIEKPTDEFMSGITIEETADNVAKFQTWAKDIKKLDQEIINLGLKILGAVNAK